MPGATVPVSTHALTNTKSLLFMLRMQLIEHGPLHLESLLPHIDRCLRGLESV